MSGRKAVVVEFPAPTAKHAAQSGSRELLANSRHATHCAGRQRAVQQVGELDEVQPFAIA